jgi:hypothetical protein
MPWIPIGLAAAALMRGLSRRPRVAAALGALLVSLVVGLSAVPAYAATCSGSTTMTIDLASGESIALSLSGGADPLGILVTPSDPSCGGFDTSTVTTIRVNGTGGNESVTIDQSGSAPFPHQNTVSIDLALGDGTDSLVITGQSTADAIGFGANGISLDAGGTPDVTGLARSRDPSSTRAVATTRSRARKVAGWEATSRRRSRSTVRTATTPSRAGTGTT